jgi:phosphotransferase system IIB component
VEVYAQTRLRIAVAHDKPLDTEALKKAGVREVMKLPGGVWHLIVGLNAGQYGVEMKALITQETGRPVGS